MRFGVLALLTLSGCVVERPLTAADFACHSGGQCSSPDGAVANADAGPSLADARVVDAATMVADAATTFIDAGRFDDTGPGFDDASAPSFHDATPIFDDATPAFDDAAAPRSDDAAPTFEDASAPVLLPDLVVTSVIATFVPGGNGMIETQVTVCNFGAGRSPSSTVRAFLSTDATITAADAAISGTASILALPAGACVTVLHRGTAPATSVGGFFTGAIVDPDEQISEDDETNNGHAGPQLTVGPDLVVTAVSVALGAMPDTVDVTCTICNQGTTPLPPAMNGPTVLLVLTRDMIIDLADYAIVPGSGITFTVTGVGDCETRTVTAPHQTGTHYIGAWADHDDDVDETNESNNTRIGNTISIGPDLVPTTVSAMLTGADVDLSVTVCNQGNAPKPGNGILAQLLWSPDATVTAADTEIFPRMIFFNALAVGACETQTNRMTLPSYPPGTRYYPGVFVDADNSLQESNENNNIAAGSAVTF